MSTRRYCVFVIPEAHKPLANLAVALLNGDDPQWSTPFGVPANVSGSGADPASHYYGGAELPEEWHAKASNLATDPDAVLPEGATWSDYGTTSELVAAECAFIHLQTTTTQDGSAPSSTGTLDNALAALGLQRVQGPA
ncbi:MAG TPA: hypothetical protein VFY63_16830 [Pseudorhizobium sp.]|nr:hypothetical protein [Pseudorhizobium sp.]